MSDQIEFRYGLSPDNGPHGLYFRHETPDIQFQIRRFDFYGISPISDRAAQNLRDNPNPLSPYLLILSNCYDFNNLDQVPDPEARKTLIKSVCQACPVLAKCGPEYAIGGLTYFFETVKGYQTDTDACALGRQGGAFIPVQHFLKNRTT